MQQATRAAMVAICCTKFKARPRKKTFTSQGKTGTRAPKAKEALHTHVQTYDLAKYFMLIAVLPVPAATPTREERTTRLFWSSSISSFKRLWAMFPTTREVEKARPARAKRQTKNQTPYLRPFTLYKEEGAGSALQSDLPFPPSPLPFFAFIFIPSSKSGEAGLPRRGTLSLAAGFSIRRSSSTCLVGEKSLVRTLPFVLLLFSSEFLPFKNIFKPWSGDERSFATSDGVNAVMLPPRRLRSLLTPVTCHQHKAESRAERTSSGASGR
mmetsp:Transcript_1297/g.3763  ORF Transcript_1297/g.3763 Transcript_1297/m.3763 type:complete len:268 (-) Transcript_1297:148-951(-)